MTTDSSRRMDAQIGRRLGRYELFRALAKGGMATVHLGRLLGPIGFARTVAIKRLHEQFAADPEFVSMFVDEARLAARIHHPNVVQTLDVIELDGELFIVMEYVHGESLSRLAKTAKAIDPKIAASIVASALQGLHAAHEAKSEAGEPLAIVHRDVSPQNILVGADGVTRVLDFGVARAAKRVQSTTSGEIKGKVRYMPPEQLRGEVVDRRADIYAAGIVLFEALTGTRYTSKEEPAAIILETLSGPPVPPSSRRPELPKELDTIVLKALAPKREDRFETAEEMALALEETIGLASPARIGKWVAEVAGPTLAERKKLVSEVEQAPAAAIDDPTIRQSSSPDLVPPARTSSPRLDPPVEAPSGVSNLVAAMPPDFRPRGRAFVLLGIAVVLGAIGILAVVSASSSSDTKTSASASASVATPPPAAVSVPAPASAEPTTTTDFELPPTTPAASSSAPAPRPKKPGPRPASTEDLFRKRR